MEITQKQIKTPTGEKCPECEGKGFILDDSELYTRSSKFPAGYYKKEICQSCNGTGLPTIEIEKEMVECRICSGQGGWYYGEDGGGDSCQDCNGEGKIPKHKIGEEIEICLNNPPCDCSGGCNNKVKLKILSETEDKQKLQMVR